VKRPRYRAMLRAGASRIRRRLHPTAPLGEPDRTDASALFGWCRAAGNDVRGSYLWGVLQAARIGAALGYPAVSVLEFGVAGGNGLIALEQAAASAESILGIEVHVFGFDTGKGMPSPRDHRDVPWLIQDGWFAMDVDRLRARLTRAHLVLGDVEDTVAAWLGAEHPPVGFCSFDLDYYSSTMAAFRLLDGDAARLLPRVPAYFDDVFGYGWSDFNGELAAIADFNDGHADRKIGKIHGLRYDLASEISAAWPDKMFVIHLFDHPKYNEPEGKIAEYWFEALKLR
jgi:hypothetical protein